MKFLENCRFIAGKGERPQAINCTGTLAGLLAKALAGSSDEGLLSAVSSPPNFPNFFFLSSFFKMFFEMVCSLVTLAVLELTL